jgi:23S rRNA (cytosine1962-C5)-methyltransferase
LKTASSSPPVRATQWQSPADFAAFAAAQTTAHRIATTSGGWAERLGDDAMISYKDDKTLDELLSGITARTAEIGWTPQRIFTRFIPLKNDERISPVLHSGDASLPLTTVVREAGTRSGLDFAAGYSHGLFLDQRANRAYVKARKPKRLLNTFSYTCSFSLVAAQSGAATVSVDLSKKSLDRGRANFDLNKVNQKGHQFHTQDTLEFLPDLAARGDRFDCIILDPPTFSRSSSGRKWQIEQHFEDLINAALELAAPHCAILLSTNCTKLDSIQTERSARFCAKVHRRTASYQLAHGMTDFPAGSGATTMWMTLG